MDIASASERQKVGSAKSVVKKVFEQKTNKTILSGDDIKFLDIVSTAKDSFTKIKLLDDSIITLGPESELLMTILFMIQTLPRLMAP